MLKRDGEHLAGSDHVPEHDESGLQLWQKLMIYTGEQARLDGHPLYVELIRRLRGANASGATPYGGSGAFMATTRRMAIGSSPSLRHVPVVTAIVDPPDVTYTGSGRSWTRHGCITGLVTSELVPAFRAAVQGVEHGRLRLGRQTTR